MEIAIFRYDIFVTEHMRKKRICGSNFQAKTVLLKLHRASDLDVLSVRPAVLTHTYGKCCLLEFLSTKEM